MISQTLEEHTLLHVNVNIHNECPLNICSGVPTGERRGLAVPSGTPKGGGILADEKEKEKNKLKRSLRKRERKRQ